MKLPFYDHHILSSSFIHTSFSFDYVKNRVAGTAMRALDTAFKVQDLPNKFAGGYGWSKG